MLATRSWVESPVTLNVVTAVGSILAGIGAVLVLLLAGPRYRLRYGPLTSKEAEDGSWKVGIYLSSRGRHDITRDAFDEGKPIELDIGVPIKRLASVWNSQGTVRIVNAQVKDTCLLVGPGLINRRQTIRFTVITDEKPTGLNCITSLIDVSVRYQELGPEGQSWVAMLVVMIPFLGISYLTIAIVNSFGVQLRADLLQIISVSVGTFLGVWNRRRNPTPRD